MTRSDRTLALALLRALAPLAARIQRLAANADPFFGDSTRFLLADQPVEEVQLLEGAGGEEIPPPSAERVLLLNLVSGVFP